mgnify:CR=1 FL=1
MVFLVVESVYDGVHPGVHVADPQDAEVQVHRSIIFLEYYLSVAYINYIR